MIESIVQEAFADRQDLLKEVQAASSMSISSLVLLSINQHANLLIKPVCPKMSMTYSATLPDILWN